MKKKAQLLLLEGVCGSGKSTLCAFMHDTQPDEVVIIDQKFTYAPIAPAEDVGLLDDELNAHVLSKQVGKLATLIEDSSARVVVIDTLHITQMIRPGVLSISNFQAVDRSLASLGCRTIFLWIDEPTIMKRTVVQRRGTGFARYAAKFGDTEKDVCSHFFHEQDAMWLAARRDSKIPLRRLDGTADLSLLCEQTMAYATE